MTYTLHTGDCLDVMRTLPDCSVDTVVTDPPAGIAFMGKDWDKDKGGRDAWVAWLTDVMREALRVTKPGGMALIWSIPRTSHWTGTAIELAGWEVRDVITHIFGSGFPKSLDISKAIDNAAGRIGESVIEIKREIRRRYESKGLTLAEFNNACGFEASGYLRESSTWANVLPDRNKWAIIKGVIGCNGDLDSLFAEAEREVIGKSRWTNSAHHFVPGENHKERVTVDITAPATPDAETWNGYGTALKPAAEFWWLAMKPLDGTYAHNAITHCVAGLWIDGARVATNESWSFGERQFAGKRGGIMGETVPRKPSESNNLGRWPANLIHDGSPEVMQVFPVTNGNAKFVGANDVKRTKAMLPASKGWNGNSLDPSAKQSPNCYGDTGSAARFFYCAKSSRAERNAGLEGLRYKLRDDLTSEQIAYVKDELAKVGVSL